MPVLWCLFACQTCFNVFFLVQFCFVSLPLLLPCCRSSVALFFCFAIAAHLDSLPDCTIRGRFLGGFLWVSLSCLCSTAICCSAGCSPHTCAYAYNVSYISRLCFTAACPAALLRVRSCCSTPATGRISFERPALVQSMRQYILCCYACFTKFSSFQIRTHNYQKNVLS